MNIIDFLKKSGENSLYMYTSINGYCFFEEHNHLLYTGTHSHLQVLVCVQMQVKCTDIMFNNIKRSNQVESLKKYGIYRPTMMK